MHVFCKTYNNKYWFVVRLKCADSFFFFILALKVVDALNIRDSRSVEPK